MVSCGLVCLILVIASTRAQPFIVAITPSSNLPIPAVQQSSGSYVFNCTATSASGPPTNVTWTSYPAGVVVQVGSLTTSGRTSSRPLTLPSPVVLSYAGLYVCTASANGVSTTASYAFNVTVSTTLSPSIMVTNTPPPPNYQGSLLTFMCTFGIGASPPGLVPASIQWVGPSQQPLVAGGLVSIQTSNSTSSGVNTFYTSNLTISALSRKDAGSYTCTPNIGPVVPSPYVIGYTASKNSPSVNIIDLPLGVTILPTSLRSSSNSSFQINCSATKPASVPLPFVFTWSWGDRYSGSVLTFNSSGVATIGGTTFVMSQPPGVSNSTPNVTSTLTVSQPLPGVYTYWCAVMVYVPVDGPVNQAGLKYLANITGPPRQPFMIRAIKVFMDTVSIQWTVPLIVYTQETYMVQYGSAPGHLGQSSNPVNGSANLNVIGGQFGANLTGLVPSSLYYYTVVASNTEGTTTTPVMNISFFPPDGVASLSVGSGDPSYINVTWRPPPPPNNDVIYYVVKTTPFGGGDVINSANVSGLSVGLTGVYAPGVPYNASVAGVNILGPGKTTTTYGYTQELAPSGTLNITVTSINGSTILLSWKPLSPVEARGFVRYYLVTWTPGTRGTRGTTGGGTANLTADTTTFLITGLDPMVTYMVSVSAGAIAGVGATTNTTAMPTVQTPVTTMATTSASPAAAAAGSCDMMTCIIPIVVVVPVVVMVAIIIISVVLIIMVSRKKKAHRHSSPEPAVVYSEIGGGSLKPPPGQTVSINQNQPPPNTEEDKNLEELALPTGKSNQAGPVYIKDFSAHVNLMHQNRDRMFDREFQSIPECQHPTEAAALPCNKSKNRFHNISPYDYNRVPLKRMEGVEGSDYINASFIDVNYDGYKKTHAYIMAQGPMPNTVSDFWRMVFEHRLDTIVMLTQCNEGGKRKCEQYWPDSVGGVIEPFPGLRVTLEEATPLADYVTRRMKVEMTGSAPLMVSHLQYEGWPDTGVPSSATSFIGFIKLVRSDHRQDGSPLVVHCSSGVGRSGVFIILDCMLERLKEKDTVNVCECFADMRRQRSFTVETLAQYVFIHDALNELITCGDTYIDASELRNRINELHRVPQRGNRSGFEEQFELLERASYKPSERDTSEAKQQYNMVKNRYEDHLPYNLSRARLRPTGVQGSEYINASCIDGYKLRNAYIAAQAPLMNTVEDFWRMVWEFKSMTIVMLCGLDEDRVVQYWPMRPGETLVYGKMAVTLMGNPADTSAKDQITVYKLELKEEKEKVPTQCSTVHLFHYTGWPGNCSPMSNASIIKMNKAVLKVQMQSGNKCTTVVCNDGMGRTGTFITIHAMMERLKTEHVVDFFQFIKSSRTHRQNFVTNMEQYILCHDTVADYVDELDKSKYANFQSHRPSDPSAV